MFLLITPIFESITFDIFSLDGEVVSKEISIPVGKDFDMFGEKTLTIIKQYNITKILAFTGPGAFTRMRIVTLTLSTYAMTLPYIDVRGGSYFDYLSFRGEPLPYMLDANRHEYLVRDVGGEYFRQKSEDFTPKPISIQYDYDSLLQYFESLPKNNTPLSPIYIKQPNITLPGKKLLHSSGLTNKS